MKVIATVVKGPFIHNTKTSAYIYTVNREYFNVKIFLDSLACVKIKRTKYTCNINGNAVQAGLFVRKLFNAKKFNYHM